VLEVSAAQAVLQALAALACSTVAWICPGVASK